MLGPLTRLQIAGCAPGFKIIDVGTSDESGGQVEDSHPALSRPSIDWQGNFIWLLCVNQDDGLRFELARTIDGEEELRAVYNDHELTGADDLQHVLAQSNLWPVYRLRAIVILQQRIFDQMQVLYSTQEEVEAVLHGDAADVRELPYQQAMKLRRLEFELLEMAYEEFERQVSAQGF